ncbi:MAG: PaaI family thioesterase [Pirellulaceae bacterium]
MTEKISVQDQYAPNLICFGCGPANKDGLQIKSFLEGDELVAEFQAQKKHQAFEGMLNGGIIGSLLDCHCNWMACIHLMKRNGLDVPPCTVTAEYTITMEKPTPIKEPLQLRAWVVDSSDRRATIEGTITAGGEVTARCRGVFVAVREGHPAFHRW